MTGEPPDARDRLARQRLDPGVRRARPPTRTPASRPRRRSAPPSRPSGRTRPACRSTPSCSAAAARPRCRWSRRRSTGSTASSSARRCRRDDRRRRRRGRQAALRPDGDAAVLRLQHGRLLRATGSRSASARGPSCRGSSTSTGSAKTPTASSSGRASARTAACSSGSSAAARGGGDGRDADRAAAGAGRAQHRRPQHPPEAIAELLSVDPELVKQQLPQVKEHLARSATSCRSRSRRSWRRSKSAYNRSRLSASMPRVTPRKSTTSGAVATSAS